MSTQSLIPASGQSEIVVPHGNLVLVADYARDSNDLTLTGPEGTVVVILGYFADTTPATLISADGARVPGDLIAQLAESADSSGQSAPDLGEPIGTADEVEGTATATLPGGTVVTLAEGDAVYQDSLIETDADGVVGITLLDGTTIGLSQSGRLLLDEFVFDSATGAGSSALTVLQGVLATVTGEIGKTNPENVSIRALTGTIGIRGTTIVIEVDRIGEVEITVVGGRIVVTLPDGRSFYLNEAGDFLSFEGSGEATFTQGGDEHLEQLRNDPAFEAALTQARADLDGDRDQPDGAEQNEGAVENDEAPPSTESGGQTGFEVKLTPEGFTVGSFEAQQQASPPSDPPPSDPPPQGPGA